jgi:hypothetical protein
LQKAQDIDSLKSNFTKECFLGKYNLSGFYANTKYFQRFLDLHVFINDNDLEGRALDETGIASAYYGGFALAKAFNDINAKMREIENTNGLFNARVIIEHQEELGRSHVRKQGGLKEGELPTYILPCYRSVVDLQRESVNQPWTITHCYPTPITCTLHDRLLITGKITSNNSYNLYYVN